MSDLTVEQLNQIMKEGKEYEKRYGPTPFGEVITPSKQAWPKSKVSNSLPSNKITPNVT